MLNMECQTKMSEEKAIETIKKFFGQGGLGLNLVDESGPCLTFEGGGGYVNATLCSEKGGTRIEMVTQEWEHQVKDFAAKLD